MALKILHLEDNAADAELVKHALMRARVDCEVKNVDSADAYERELRQQAYDVILSDSGIPGYDGRAALKLALESRPGTPFIVVSGYVDGIPAALPHEPQPTARVSKSRLETLAEIIKSNVQADKSPASASERYTRGTQYLISVIQALSLARDLPTVMDIVRHAARRLVGADGATFVLRDDGRCYYAEEDAIAPLWKGQRFPLSACISGWAMINRRAVAIPDIYQDARIPHDAYRPTFVKSLVMTPIRTANPVGAIGVYWAALHVTSNEEIALLTALADSTSVAMESVDLIANLESRVAQRTEEVRERQAELEVLNKELEAFSYSVAHDLRSPLLNIDGFAHLLAETCGESLSGEGREYLGRITAASARMQGLINDLLALSRIVRAPMNQTEVDLARLARDIVAGLQERAPERKVEFSVRDAAARGDAGMLRIVLENLLSNAWKFTSKTPGAKVQLGISERGERMTTFFLRDNGAGFDPRYTSNLFSPFHRLHTQEQFPGTGIGLATVRRIVNRHGGEIHAEGAVNKGATFYFSLPTIAGANVRKGGP
jgi:signal transduction histidine kinase/CheY-like chemotaxis protein